MKKKSINTDSISGQLYNILRDAILKGFYQIGEKLPSEEKLSSEYSISKNSVREALGLLISEGLIEKRRGHTGGSFVSQPTPKRILQSVTDIYHLGGYSLDEVIEFRSRVEPISIDLACLRRTEEDLKHMQRNLLISKKQLDRNKVDREKQLDFHRLIAAASKNGLILVVIRATLAISKEITMQRDLSIQEGLQDYELNLRFYDCILGRKPQQGIEFMKEHFKIMNEIQKDLKNIQ